MFLLKDNQSNMPFNTVSMEEWKRTSWYNQVGLLETRLIIMGLYFIKLDIRK